MADIETNMRIDYKYSALNFNDYVQVQHELTLLPKSEIRKVLTIPDYEIPLIDGELPINDYEHKNKFKNIDKDALRKDIMNKEMSIRNICKKYNIKSQLAYSFITELKKSGIKVPSRIRPSKDYMLPEILKCLDMGYSQGKISKVLNMPESTVYVVIKRYKQRIKERI